MPLPTLVGPLMASELWTLTSPLLFLVQLLEMILFGFGVFPSHICLMRARPKCQAKNLGFFMI